MAGKKEVFIFLDALRRSGAVNMFSASSYIEEEFDLPNKESKQLLVDWMETFDDEISVEDRIKQLKSS